MAKTVKNRARQRVWGETSDGITVLPPDASDEEQLKAAFPHLPPPAGSPEAEAWTRLGLQPPVRDSRGT